MTIGDGEIHLDFTGSDVQVGSALNVPTAGRVHPFMSVALVNYFATRDRTIPLNAGVLKRVRMTLPEGSVVNPTFPAACGVRYATVLRIYDAVLGALARAVPAHIPAASGGQGCMVALALPDPEAGRRHVTVIEPMIGGGGGRPGQRRHRRLRRLAGVSQDDAGRDARGRGADRRSALSPDPRLGRPGTFAAASRCGWTSRSSVPRGW